MLKKIQKKKFKQYFCFKLSQKAAVKVILIYSQNKRPIVSPKILVPIYFPDNNIKLFNIFFYNLFKDFIVQQIKINFSYQFILSFSQVVLKIVHNLKRFNI